MHALQRLARRASASKMNRPARRSQSRADAARAATGVCGLRLLRPPAPGENVAAMWPLIAQQLRQAWREERFHKLRRQATWWAALILGLALVVGYFEPCLSGSLPKA